MSWPFIADRIARLRSDEVVAAYDAAVAATAPDEINERLSAARRYNEGLVAKGADYELARRVQALVDRSHHADEGATTVDATTDASTVEAGSLDAASDAEAEAAYRTYCALLSFSDTMVMGYLTIDALGLKLPIYHGTSDAELQKGAGHLIGSSLPVGGPSSHCVLCAHSGLPSAELFSHLSDLRVGDRFTLTVLTDRLTYEVDQILIVEPDRTEALAIVPGADLCTLLTCTPYGINTHRLLVRGHRCPSADVTDETPAMATLPLTVIVGVVAAVGLLGAALLVRRRMQKRRRSHRW